MSQTSVMSMLKSIHTQTTLPPNYMGRLTAEFDTIVMLQELACLSMAFNKQTMSNDIFVCMAKFVQLVNKFYFAMYGEKAPRLSEQDGQLSQRHALSNLPLDPSGTRVVMDQALLDRSCRATANIISQTIDSTSFVMTQFITQHEKAKAQCKHARKHGMNIITLLDSLKLKLDKEHELSHAYVDKNALEYTDLTDNERRMTQRKRRAR